MENAFRHSVTGLILAGGRGARMGGADKGLLPLDQRPLVAATRDRLAPQVGTLLICANRNLAAYCQLGHTVISDVNPGSYDGPLAGLSAGLSHCTTPYLAVAPCDAPHLPADLIERLSHALADGAAPLAYAATAARSHPVFMLCRQEVLGKLETFLAAGGRKVRDWQVAIGAVAIMFDDEAEFTNVNSPEDLARLQQN